MMGSLVAFLKSVWAWMLSRPCTVAFVLFALVISIPILGRQYSEWELVYLQAARRLAEGNHLYQPPQGYLYPPFMAWTALPFLALSPWAGRLVWLGLNLVALLLMFRWAWKLAYGPRVTTLRSGIERLRRKERYTPAPPGCCSGSASPSLRRRRYTPKRRAAQPTLGLTGTDRSARTEQLACFLGALCGLPHLQNCLAHQQTDVLIGALLMGGILLLERARPLLAAGSFGLAAACKCTGLLWAPYLFWRRRPLAACCLVGVALGVNLLPDLVYPPATPEVRGRKTSLGGTWLGEYARQYLRPLARADHRVGTWGSELIYNQSLAGAGQRWLCTSWHWHGERGTVVEHPDRVSPGLLKWGVLAGEGLLILVVLVVAGNPLGRLREGTKDGVPSQGLEGSVVLLLMLLLSPMSSKAHFGVLILPGFCLARAWLRPRQGQQRRGVRRTILGGLLLLAVFLSLAANKDLVGGRLYTLALWLGNTTWQALALLAGCLVVLAQKGWLMRLRISFNPQSAIRNPQSGRAA
jgi:hypothetical protein